MDTLFEIRNLRCAYGTHHAGGEPRVVLEIRHLDIPKGEKIFIVGESGIGKSTILEVLGMMNNTIVPDKDTRFVFFEEDGHAVNLLDLWASGDDNSLSSFRLKHFNFIFQNTNLMQNFTAYENIAMTRMLQGYSAEESFNKAATVLEELGMPHIQRNRMAQELSGGQQQRLAFARAILPDFTVLFGDEPTGNLDSDNAFRSMELLAKKMDVLSGSSAIIVTHDMHLATQFADRVVKIRKQFRKAANADEVNSYYGLVDSESVFTYDKESATWGNGSVSFQEKEFELYLKKAS